MLSHLYSRPHQAAPYYQHDADLLYLNYASTALASSANSRTAQRFFSPARSYHAGDNLLKKLIYEGAVEHLTGTIEGGVHGTPNARTHIDLPILLLKEMDQTLR